MNRNVTPLILIVLAIGIYFTFTRAKIDEVKAVQIVNAQYQQALDNSERLVKKRDEILAIYNRITPEDQNRLERMIPDNVDNVRLIIDVNSVAAKHGLTLKNVKTSTTKDQNPQSSKGGQSPTQVPNSNVLIAGGYDTVTLSFDVSGSYQNFLDFLRSMEKSLRIMEISRISLKVNDAGTYDYGLEFKTFWLRK